VPLVSVVEARSGKCRNFDEPIGRYYGLDVQNFGTSPAAVQDSNSYVNLGTSSRRLKSAPSYDMEQVNLQAQYLHAINTQR